MTNDRVEDPKASLRWYQFSLRSLLIFVTLFAIPCSWIAVKMKPAKQQQEVVEAVIKLGGSVRYDYEELDDFGCRKYPGPPGPAWLRNLLGVDFLANVTHVSLEENTTDADLKRLETLNRLQNLSVCSSHITDIGLEHLKVLNQLEDLDLWKIQVSSTGLEHLKNLKQLSGLRICETTIDTGLEHLKCLNQLQSLSFYNTKILNNGFEHLNGFKQLHFLDLSSTNVTDKDLQYLQGLHQLGCIHLEKTNVTDSGVTKLKEILPELRCIVLK